MNSMVSSGRRQNKRKWYRYLLWGDYLIYVVVIVLAIALFLSLPLLRGGEASAAIVAVDGRIVREIPLAELEKNGGFDLDANGFHYHFVYEDSRIRFAEADCPDQVCVRTGWISRSGDMAACVPGRLILRIVGTPGNTQETDDVDVIVR